MDDQGSLTKAVNRLTIAVWCIFALWLAQFALGLWAMYRPQSFAASGIVTDTPNTAIGTSMSSITEENDFRALPPERKVKLATVILITRYKKEEGQVQSVISEILKKSPNTRFYYNVGDNYAELSHFRLPNEEVHGDGQLVLLTGNPATMREAYSYSEDRIGGLGQMPLARLRQLVEVENRPPN